VLAQAFLRRHGEHAGRVVFANTEGADNLVALPGVWDLLIRKLSYFASRDAGAAKNFPDVETLYRRVLDKLERAPLTLTVTDARTNRPTQIRVGKIGLQFIVRMDMADARTYSTLPALFQLIERGDYSILTKQIEALYNEFTGRSPMANGIDCSLGWSAARWAQAQSETRGALSSSVNLQWTSGVCQSLGVAGQNATPTARLWSAAPALFISGTLDTNTPPFQAEELRWGFPDSTHLIVENGGHETLPSTEVQAIVVDFFKGQDVGARSVRFDPPRFMSIDELKSRGAGGRR
jgi:pimeloyl-ACP methyl ester carboxylesterase